MRLKGEAGSIIARSAHADQPEAEENDDAGESRHISAEHPKNGRPGLEELVADINKSGCADNRDKGENEENQFSTMGRHSFFAFNEIERPGHTAEGYIPVRK